MYLLILHTFLCIMYVLFIHHYFSECDSYAVSLSHSLFSRFSFYLSSHYRAVQLQPRYRRMDHRTCSGLFRVTLCGFNVLRYSVSDKAINSLVSCSLKLVDSVGNRTLPSRFRTCSPAYIVHTIEVM